jgi:hypothetical protein
MAGIGVQWRAVHSDVAGWWNGDSNLVLQQTCVDVACWNGRITNPRRVVYQSRTGRISVASWRHGGSCCSGWRRNRLDLGWTVPDFGLLCSKINQCTLSLHSKYTRKVHQALCYCFRFLPHLIQFSSLLAYCVGQWDFNSPSDEHSVMDSHAVTFCNPGF